MWRFSTRRISVKVRTTACRNKVTLSLTWEGSGGKSRAQIVLEKARRCFSVAACHREGGVCVYSNKNRTGCQRAHGSSPRLAKRGSHGLATRFITACALPPETWRPPVCPAAALEMLRFLLLFHFIPFGIKLWVIIGQKPHWRFVWV